jgi:hypothetical protein
MTRYQKHEFHTIPTKRGLLPVMNRSCLEFTGLPKMLSGFNIDISPLPFAKEKPSHARPLLAPQHTLRVYRTSKNHFRLESMGLWDLVTSDEGEVSTSAVCLCHCDVRTNSMPFHPCSRSIPTLEKLCPYACFPMPTLEQLSAHACFP